MCKLAHVIRYTVLLQNFHFCCFHVLERWLIHFNETKYSFVYLIPNIHNFKLNSHYLVK